MYLQLDKEALVNLNYSLHREYIRANRNGSYASSTLVQCHTRKYHGLLVVQQPQIDHEWHVLLSNVDETIVQQGQSFNLALRRYKGGNYAPRGHKYIADYGVEPIPKITYQVANCILTKELLLIHNEDRILVRYTLVHSTQPTSLQLRPFLAFRGRHALAKANTYINKKYEDCENGNVWQLYENYDPLCLQISKKNTFTPVPDWYYDCEYTEEQARGYEALEDLYAPGFYEVSLKEGESIVFSAGTTPTKTAHLKKLFDAEVARRTPRRSFENCLINAAEQFVIDRPDAAFIIAGFPWFGSWARDTFIALPGLTIANQNVTLYEKVLATQIKTLKNGMFPNTGGGEYNSADAPLWFFWSLQQYQQHFKPDMPHAEMWDKYGNAMHQILEAYRHGTQYNIAMHPNSLIWQGADGYALTWMDALTDGQAVTPRRGYAVEINALWYNAVCYALLCARQAHDLDFINQYDGLPEQIKTSFVQTFWSADKNYCADYVNEHTKDLSVRPNMLFATSLPFSPLNDEQKHGILERIKSELVTPRGLRSLAPKNPLYKGHYEGNQADRDAAYHNGTVWAWLTGHYAEAVLKLYGQSQLNYVERLYANFESCMYEHGITTISEIFDGDPPHVPRGAISQAWSVAEVLRMGYLIETTKAEQ